MRFHTEEFMGFTIIEPTYTHESEPQIWTDTDMDLIPGIAEAQTIEQMDAALMAYWGNLPRR